jgi:hypothetical protein
MRIFHCDHCDSLVFFENVHCLSCGHALAYAPDAEDVLSLEPSGEGRWRAAKRRAADREYRLCANYDRANVCNWAMAADDPEPLCVSCRLTRTIPDLAQAGHKEAWYRLEVAKRRLIYSLLRLGLPIANKTVDPERGVVFDLLAETEAMPVLTGHSDGVITINVAEADDAERERRRLQLHEPYRTLLGHFRHEIGHYYWERLLAGSDRLDAFRAAFGDERVDYAEALKRHYEQGPPEQWQERFISTYASAHPWEDWAETWAHYLHMTDALETAAACGLSLRPRRSDEPALKTAGQDKPLGPFEQKIEAWFPLTYVLNNLNRGLGLTDGYPFVLSPPVIAKLRFVHDTITETAAGTAAIASAPAATPAPPAPATEPPSPAAAPTPGT